MKRFLFISLAFLSIMSISMAQPIADLTQVKVSNDNSPMLTHKSNGTWNILYSGSISGKMTSPIGMVKFGDYLYTASAASAKLYKIQNNTAIDSFSVSGLPQSSTTGAYAIGFAHDDSSLYITNGNAVIYRLNSALNAVESTITISTNAIALAYDPKGDNGKGCFYTSTTNGGINAYSKTGTLLSSITSTDIGFSTIFWNMACDTNGYIYTLERAPQKISRIDPATKKVNAPIHNVTDDRPAWEAYYAYGLYIDGNVMGVFYMAKYFIQYDMSTVNQLPDNGVHIAEANMPMFHKVNTPLTISSLCELTGKNPLTSFTYNYVIDDSVYTENITGVNFANYTKAFTLNHNTTYTPTTNNQKYTVTMWLSNINNSGVNSDTLTYTFETFSQSVQRNVLHEVFSASTCPPCKPGNANLKSILDANDNWVCIKYQMNFPSVGDPYYTSEVGSRSNYYGGISSVPHMFTDGNYWDGNTNSYTSALLKARIPIPAFIDMDATFNYDGNKKFSTSITINPLKTYGEGDYRLFVALVEKKTYKNRHPQANDYNLTNAQLFSQGFDTLFHHVMKKFMTSISGQSVTLTENTPVTVNLEYEFKGEYRLPTSASTPINHSTENSVENFNNIYVVYWVQNYKTKEVLQAGKAGKASAINDLQNIGGNVMLFPNPAQNMLNIVTEGEIEDVAIFNVLGQKVMHANTNQIDITSLSKGMYIINITTDEGMTTKKFVKE